MARAGGRAMKQNITLFADADIVSALREYLSHNRSFELGYVAKSYQDCYEPSVVNNACALILQGNHHMAGCLDLMYDLDQPGYSPIILMFEKTPDGRVMYTTTDPAVNHIVGRIAMLFENALDGLYECDYRYFRPATESITEWIKNSFSKREALNEILRGCSARETDVYKKMYKLDLREQGYYLFFWELQSMEYSKHQDNKDVYNYIGDTLERQFAEVLSEFGGGEVVRLTLNKRCIIINDIHIRSQAGKTSKFEELIHRLVKCGRSKTAGCYLSERVDHLQGLRRARDKYESEKAGFFFLRNVPIIRAKDLARMRSNNSISLEAVIPLVHSIGNFIRYDITNPELLVRLHELYFNVLKPSMSYTLYYFCVASICSDLVKESGTADIGMLTENLTPELLRFSSIEEQYAVMCRNITALQSKAAGKRKTKNAIVLQVLNYIDENLSSEISVPEMANSLYVSHIYLSQIFKNIMGVSIISYIVNLRIEKAKRALEDTDELVYDIAEAVGFQDAKHFSKTFKRIVGSSPTEYRKNIRKKR